MRNKKKTVIMGAGISGLSIGYNLSRNNINVEVYESSGGVGGIAKSIKHKGYLFDSGPHGYHSLNPKMINFFKEIMGDNIIEYDKDTEIKYKGRYFKYPLKPLNVLFSMSLKDSVISISQLLYNKIKYKFIKPKDRNAEEWIVNRFGRSLYNVFFKDYTKKTWGVSPKMLSATFAQHRVPVISFSDLILRGVFGFKKHFGKQNKYAETAVRIYYPQHGGIGAFSKKMCDKIIKFNGKVNLNSEVKKVELKDNKIKSVTIFKKREQKKIKGNIFVSTIPINELVKIISPRLEKEVIEAAKRLEYRSILIFCILVKKDQVFKTLHYYYYDKYFGRLTELKNWSRWLYPKGVTALIAEKTCDYNDRLWKGNENELFEKVINDIKKEGFIEEKDIIDKFIIKIRYGYPVYSIGYEKNLKIVDDRLKMIKNLYLSGRQAKFRYMDMDNCIEEGLEIVKKIIKIH